MTANPTNQINKRTMKFEKEFNEAHPEMIGEKDRAFYESNYMDWLEDQYITANSLEPKTEQPTGETVFRKVSVTEDNIKKVIEILSENAYTKEECEAVNWDANKIEHLDATQFYNAVCIKLLEEIPIPTQSAKSGEQESRFPMWMQAIGTQAYIHGYEYDELKSHCIEKYGHTGNLVSILESTIKNLLEHKCSPADGLNKEEIIKWIDGNKKEVENGNIINQIQQTDDFVDADKLKQFILSLPTQSLPTHETIKDAIEALDWALNNTTCEDRLQSDKFNILTNAMMALKSLPQSANGWREKTTAIEFYKWMKGLTLTDRVTVHPPAGSGSGFGLYTISYEDLYDKFAPSLPSPPPAQREEREAVEQEGVPLMEIIVNGKRKPWTHLSITYEQLIVLAFGVIKNELIYNYTVTYSHGEDKSQGSLIKGQKVTAVMNMIFNISMTNKS